MIDFSVIAALLKDIIVLSGIYDPKCLRVSFVVAILHQDIIVLVYLRVYDPKCLNHHPTAAIFRRVNRN